VGLFSFFRACLCLSVPIWEFQGISVPICTCSGTRKKNFPHFCVSNFNTKKMDMIKKYAPLIAVVALGLGLYIYFTQKDNKDKTPADKTAEFLGFRK
jgi:hypothetical protein